MLLNTYAILGKYSGQEKRTRVKKIDSGYL
jgi:hypothetical protein